MAARQSAARKTTTRATKSRATTKTAEPVKKIKAIKERFTKTQILDQIAQETELTRKQVSTVLDELSNVIEGHVTKRSCGEFVLPGLLKIVSVKKPAKRARKGINPFTGEETVFAAKPASTQIKIRPLKKLKDMPL